MRRRLVATLAVAGLAAAGCSNGDDDVAAPLLVTTSTSAAADESPTSDENGPTFGVMEVVPTEIGQVACPDSIASDLVACGVATVALDRTGRVLDTTEITVATMEGYDSGFVTPLVVLQGGPGGASSDLAGWFPQQPFTQVFIDQRGTGFRGAEFDCTEYDEALDEIFAAPGAEAGRLTAEALDACARRLRDDPLFEHTTTQSHAQDVISVMNALGYQRYVVYGVSYGSTIGFELLRMELPTVAGVVLDGVYPPDIDIDEALVRSASRAIATVGDACSLSAVCTDYTDDFGALVERLIEQLDADPMVVTLSGNESGFDERVDVVLDGTRLAELTFLLLYSEARVRHLPSVLAAIEAGDESAARWLTSVGVRTMVAAYGANDEATFFAVQCSDRFPFTDGPGAELDPFSGVIASAPISESCESWNQSEAHEIVAAPVESDTPTLLLSGQFDPITPPEFADAAADRLSNATVVTQDGRGHGIWYGNECIASIVRDFVADPDRRLDVSCAADGVPVDWARP